MTVKELKEELDKWDDDAAVEWYKDAENEGIGIFSPTWLRPAAPVPEHIIEI